MRRGLGFKLVRHEAGLREFLLFLARKQSARITVNLALEWATQHANHTPWEWAARLTIVRGFARGVVGGEKRHQNRRWRAAAVAPACQAHWRGRGKYSIARL